MSKPEGVKSQEDKGKQCGSSGENQYYGDDERSEAQSKTLEREQLSM